MMGIGGSNGTFQDGLGCDCEAGWRFAQSEKVGYGQRRKSRGGGGGAAPSPPPPPEIFPASIFGQNWVISGQDHSVLGQHPFSFLFVCLSVVSVNSMHEYPPVILLHNKRGVRGWGMHEWSIYSL